MKKSYEVPAVTVVNFSSEDIITTSAYDNVRSIEDWSEGVWMD